MTTESRPSWLIIQEHGVLAEARTRAFLLDRLWVLERSVDIDGADFIVQRRLTNRSLLDPSPPRLGFIQAKYYANADTTQYVHKEYVVDTAGNPRAEFFLICHTGNEDGKRIFVLSAMDISAHFQVTPPEHSHPGRFALRGKNVLTQRFEVIDHARALDQIDNALRDADFYKNRSFLSWALPHHRDLSVPILPMYKEPIDNWWGDIEKGFVRIRERARKAQWDISEVLRKLREIEESSDPEQALSIAEDLWIDYHGQLSLPKDLWHEDFFHVVREHKRRVNQLNDAGLMSAYTFMRRATIDHVTEYIVSRVPMASDDVYVIRLRYDPDTFLQVRHESRIQKASILWPTGVPDTPATEGVLKSAPGDIELFILLGRYNYERFENGNNPWEEKIARVVEGAAGKLLLRMLEVKFGE